MKNDDERASEALVILLGMLFLTTCMGLVTTVVLAVAKLFGT
jgi:hypothetical protein